jgi:hypothetical protein
LALPEYPEEPPPMEGSFALLGHADDLSIETTPLGGLRPAAVALVGQPGETDGDAKRAWRERAMDDAADRWAAHYGTAVERLPRWDALPAWVASGGYEGVVLMPPFVGDDADAWRPVRRALSEAGVKAIECRRGWDQRLFPAARAGFFPFWHQTRSGLMKRFR